MKESLVGKYVTARPVRLRHPRQGWVLSEDPLTISGAGREKPLVCHPRPVTVVINPPERTDAKESNRSS